MVGDDGFQKSSRIPAKRNIFETKKEDQKRDAFWATARWKQERPHIHKSSHGEPSGTTCKEESKHAKTSEDYKHKTRSIYQWKEKTRRLPIAKSQQRRVATTNVGTKMGNGHGATQSPTQAEQEPTTRAKGNEHAPSLKWGVGMRVNLGNEPIKWTWASDLEEIECPHGVALKKTKKTRESSRRNMEAI